MFAILGIILVFAAVLGGFLLEKGNPWVLLQPAELLIIGGSAAGIMVISYPPSVLRKIRTGLFAIFRSRGPEPVAFLRHLQLLYEIFVYSQRAGGILSLEKDIDAPDKSQIFSRHPAFLADHATRDFVCDTLRMLVIGVTTPRELDLLMELDIDVRRRGQNEPVRALATVAESLPGMGIVAAVLGVVITMEAIGGSAESVGQKVAAALVGTFLGILLCYGVLGPLAARLESMMETESQFFQVLRIAIMSFAQGASPILAIEYARRSIPLELRPSFVAMENTLRHDAVIPPLPKPQDAESPHEAAVESA
jgi:chemotaxis protein MotA